MFLRILALFLICISFAVQASEVQLLNGGRESLKVRLNLIDRAEKEILISYFIFANDETSHVFLAHLRAAARRNVKVKILVDSLFNDVPKAMTTHLVQEGLELREYNKVTLKNFLKLTHRMHDKIFMVDGETAILGGRNIEDTYYDQSEGGKKNYYDRDIKIKGPGVAGLRDYFLELWASDLVTPAKQSNPKRKKTPALIEESVKILDVALETDLFSGENFKELDAAIQVDDSMINLVHDLIMIRKPKISGTAKSLFDLIDSAKESIMIDSPYFIMTRDIKIHLRDAIKRGVKVRLLTNSAKATDGVLPLAGYIGQRKKIVKMGIEVYEYYGDYSFHAKSLIIDSRIAMVGSFNFDPRSQKLNTETVAIVDDATVAAQLLQAMDEALTESYKLDERGRPEGFNRKYPGVGLKKTVITKLIQFLFVPWGRVHL